MDESEKESQLKQLQLKRTEAAYLRKKAELESVLPHLYIPMYKWQRSLFESTNRVNLLTAANQIGKSSALIRRAIANCTDPRRWVTLWGENIVPRQMWYFYPDGLTVEKEVTTKWVPEWLPRKEMERDPQYGWKISNRNGRPDSITFNAGPTIYFQTYSKSVSNVQAGSVYELFADEETPMDFYDELMFRLTATNGIFTSGFTPTLNQLFWKQAMEGDKVLPLAFKQVVSMYDCLKYEDGSPSRVMSMDKIKLAESRCKSDTEKQRRIWGRFITEEGRTYYGFEFERNIKPPHSIRNWYVYAAVDYGSGSDGYDSKSKRNHPAAIVFIAVHPEYKKGVVFKSWRGDGVKTTAGDVFNKYMELKEGIEVTQACYDGAAVDFGTIAQRNGVSFQKADKSRDAGEDLLNTLFKHNMLHIFDDEADNMKLASELMHMMISNQTSGGKKEDDLADALRYACMLVNWDLTVIQEKSGSDEVKETVTRPLTDQEYVEWQIKARRGEDVRHKDSKDEGWSELDDEFDMWNEQYGN